MIQDPIIKSTVKFINQQVVSLLAMSQSKHIFFLLKGAVIDEHNRVFRIVIL